MYLEIRHLKLIAAVAELGSVTRAGERLCLTQPALSHQLRHIEEQVGERVFVRGNRGMLLTPAGEKLYDAARRALAEFRHFEQEARRISHPGSDALRVAVESDAWIRGVIRVLQQQAGVAYEIVEEATRWPVDALAAGLVDIALVTRDVRDDGIRRARLFRDELVVIVRPTHDLAGRPWCELADLLGETVLTYRGSAEEWALTVTAMDAADVRPSRVADVELDDPIPDLVAAGFGVSVMSRMGVKDALASGEIVAVPLTRDGLYRIWSAVTLGRDVPTSVSRRFIDDITAMALTDGARACDPSA
ncbi:MAG TPA: LysR family transcriptional regulator [Vicinamibacterales bacterium]|nr:LysR family transcriptional regulator [Vicinamibacterales bacterium]